MRNTRKFKVEGDYVLFGTGELDVFQHSTLYMDWCEIGGKTESHLVIPNDVWSEIIQFCDLWQNLSKPRYRFLTQGQFIEILKECGFKDLDSYKKNTRLINGLVEEYDILRKRMDIINNQLEELDAD